MKNPAIIVVDGAQLGMFLKCIDAMRSEGSGISRIVLVDGPNGTVTVYPRVLPRKKQIKKIPLKLIEGGKA